ncbi:hypothetical protein RISK_003417 [Rhodopirellula islandica]|uniref:Uncharacterized protein n=1 Tax=Rhodopirellula islandica TaxID=595434 RepID=A0A0J1BCQ8_RHOIS|nr:hypothetical protein RISK_003417 [Rhodopirellula islandica]
MSLPPGGASFSERWGERGLRFNRQDATHGPVDLISRFNVKPNAATITPSSYVVP